MSKFAKQLKKLRTSHGLTQEQLANEVGVVKSAISMYESGKRQPSFELMESIADFFGIPLFELFDANTPNASTDYLLGNTDDPTAALSGEIDLTQLAGFIAQADLRPIKVIGTVKAGYDGIAFEEFLGYELSDVRCPDDHFYLQVSGDSMEPYIYEGDLALIRRQPAVENGDIAVVILNGDEGTLKKFIISNRQIVLQAFNNRYPPRILTKEEARELIIVGKLIETIRKKKW